VKYLIAATSALALFSCATATPPPSYMCVQLAQLHADQAKAHAGAEKIKDPRVRADLEKALADLDENVALADQKVSATGQCRDLNLI
jgi:hypothetical protein